MASVGPAVRRHPAVTGLRLIGSRARGEATALSDWDLEVESSDPVEVARHLPALVAPLQPLAAQWDRLSEHPCFMLVLPEGTKVDLFPGGHRPVEPPWTPGPTTLTGIDAHAWDWLLWLGGKALAGRRELVGTELVKLHDHLLGPLGASAAAASVAGAVERYVALRADAERRFGVVVDRRLGHVVVGRLRAAGVLTGGTGPTPRC